MSADNAADEDAYEQIEAYRVVSSTIADLIDDGSMFMHRHPPPKRVKVSEAPAEEVAATQTD